MTMHIYLTLYLNLSNHHPSNHQPKQFEFEFDSYESCKQKDTDGLVPENWCMDTTNNFPRYVGGDTRPLRTGTRTRTIRHYTHEGYEHCLTNKTLVFIGDSRVRYQFMSLALFLESKTVLKCEDYQDIFDSQNSNNNNNTTELPFTPDPNCFLINETLETMPWNDWYQKTTAALPGSLCDCYRPLEFTPSATFENRFVRRSTQYGGAINLVYLQSFENNVRMNEDFPPFAPYEFYDDVANAANNYNATATTRCKPGLCGAATRTNAFEGDVIETLRSIVPKLNATHVFVQSGWQFVDLSCELWEFETNHPGIRAFLITHPYTEMSLDLYPEFDATNLTCDSGVIDRSVVTKGVPKNWFWDDLHVYGIVNEAFNHLVMEHVCPIQG